MPIRFTMTVSPCLAPLGIAAPDAQQGRDKQFIAAMDTINKQADVELSAPGVLRHKCIASAPSSQVAENMKNFDAFG